MPKIIGELRGSILERARRVLFSDGYAALTMRDIAASCGVAVGTVYNYFASKDMLVAAVMLEDWQVVLARMDAPAESADAVSALRRVFRELMSFYKLYGAVWTEYKSSGRSMPPISGYHLQLVGQLEKAVAAALEPFGAPCSPALHGFLAEALLAAASRGEERFDELESVFAKLLA